MNLDEFVDFARETPLTPRQAEALYRRATGEARREAAEAMGVSPSNLDNAEREARTKIMEANNLLSLAAAIDAEPSDHGIDIGTCSRCDEPTDQLIPDLRAEHKSLEEKPMLCPECAVETGVREEVQRY